MWRLLRRTRFSLLSAFFCLGIVGGAHAAERPRHHRPPIDHEFPRQAGRTAQFARNRADGRSVESLREPTLRASIHLVQRGKFL